MPSHPGRVRDYLESLHEGMDLSKENSGLSKTLPPNKEGWIPLYESSEEHKLQFFVICVDNILWVIYFKMCIIKKRVAGNSKGRGY